MASITDYLEQYEKNKKAGLGQPAGKLDLAVPTTPSQNVGSEMLPQIPMLPQGQAGVAPEGQMATPQVGTPIAEAGIPTMPQGVQANEPGIPQTQSPSSLTTAGGQPLAEFLAGGQQLDPQGRMIDPSVDRSSFNQASADREARQAARPDFGEAQTRSARTVTDTERRQARGDGMSMEDATQLTEGNRDAARALLKRQELGLGEFEVETPGGNEPSTADRRLEFDIQKYNDIVAKEASGATLTPAEQLAREKFEYDKDRDTKSDSVEKTPEEIESERLDAEAKQLDVERKQQVVDAGRKPEATDYEKFQSDLELSDLPDNLKRKAIASKFKLDSYDPDVIKWLEGSGSIEDVPVGNEEATESSGYSQQEESGIQKVMASNNITREAAITALESGGKLKKKTMNSLGF